MNYPEPKNLHSWYYKPNAKANEKNAMKLA